MDTKIQDKFPDAVLETKEFRGETSISVQPTALRDVLSFCKSDLGYDYLLDITSIDHFETEPRWEIVYELYSMDSRGHLRIKVQLEEDANEAPTVSDLWPTADWHEREIFDMMGIRFTDHPDLRRILMWDGYPYYPLRKDFPLEGKPSDVPEVAFTDVAPLAGGPFVTVPIPGNTQAREPRARRPGELAREAEALAPHDNALSQPDRETSEAEKPASQP